MRSLDCDAAEPLLSAWLDAELPAGDRGRVGAHLQGCPRCRRAVQGLRVTATLLAGAPVRRLPEARRAAMIAAARGVDAADGTRPRFDLDSGRQRHARGPQAGVRALRRAVALAAALLLVLATTAFAVGAEAPRGMGPPRQVAVPVDVYVVDHLAQTRDGAMPTVTPVLLESAR